MFFVTVKFNRKTAVTIILAAAAILIALIIIFSSGSTAAVSNSAMLETTQARTELLQGLGWEVEAKSETVKTVLIPREFTGVYLEYNELQKKQGFDLSNFKGAEVQMYSYIVTNYKSSENVVACIYIYNGQLIGGDIHSTTLGGFMHGLK